MGWLIAAGYVTGFIITWRMAFIRMLDGSRLRHTARQQRMLFNIGPWDRVEEAGWYLVMSCLVALVWPAGLPFLLLAQWITRPTPDELTESQHHADQAELDRLRKLARKHNLPMDF